MKGWAAVKAARGGAAGRYLLRGCFRGEISQEHENRNRTSVTRRDGFSRDSNRLVTIETNRTLVMSSRTPCRAGTAVMNSICRSGFLSSLIDWNNFISRYRNLAADFRIQ